MKVDHEQKPQGGFYEALLHAMHETFDRAPDKLLPDLRQRIEEARDRLSDFSELTREEVERVSDYLERDVQDAAHFMVSSGRHLREWIRFDVDLIEERLWQAFQHAADQTSLELRELAELNERASIYHTGEVTGPGVLACTGCGKEMHFKKAGHIPPCPRCHKTELRRVE